MEMSESGIFVLFMGEEIFPFPPVQLFLKPSGPQGSRRGPANL